MKTIVIGEYTTIPVKTKYGDGSLALILLDKEDISGSLITVATVNLGTPGLAKNEQFVKDYSENSGVLAALNKAGLIKSIIREQKSGFVTIPLVEFNLEGIPTMEEIESGTQSVK